MDNTIKKNYLYNLMYEILALIVPLITTPYVSRVLGATAIGDYSYTAGIVIYFSLVAYTGTKTYGQREIARAQDNIYERSKIFYEIFIFRFLCTIIALLLYIFFVLNFLIEYRILFIIQIFTFLAWIIDLGYFFQGLENFKITAIRNTAVKLISTGAIFLFVKSPDDLWIYTLILTVSAVIGNATMWKYLPKQICKVKLRQLEIKKNISPIISLFIPVIAMQLYTVLDKTMLGTFCNTTETGYYTQAQKIIAIAITIISSLISVMLPRITKLSSERNKEQINQHFSQIIFFIFLLGLPMMLGLIAVSDLFVPFFFGPGYDSVVDLLKIQSILFIVLGIGQLLGSFLIALDKQRYFTIGVSLAAAVNVVLNYLFIKVLGLEANGASVASVIAETVSTCTQLFYIRKYVDITIILKGGINYLVPSIIMFGTIQIIRSFLPFNLFSLVVSIIAAIIIYFAILLVKKDKFMMSFIKRKRVSN